MTSEDRNTTNKVHLSGEIVTEPELTHEICGEGFYEFFLSVPRLSEQTDIIPVTVAERLLCEIHPKAGDRITVDGQFRSYNKMADGHSKLMLTVFVKELEEADGSDPGPNTVELTGYICKPPVYRTTPLSREICDMLLAVNRAFNKSDYIPCIAWGRNARYCKTLPVGTKLRVAGRVQSRRYVKKLSEEVSETRTAYEISVGRIERAEEESGAEDVAATTSEDRGACDEFT
ncbi:MAG TPA: single-stranded DNA-binding protein [Candidatus Protoclostridium stercorigallinarum]|uniref:Single-stranded DNA-binding protein n=1 Tax=Candidatus Protoclostridium stercorigallinarum TaxID=2838741 RepID=A0A9D1Q094_9FIRM|nr:single-stranded DNA-binding protein [Candidatus Protoclostridium stercorigallinarum]